MDQEADDDHDNGSSKDPIDYESYGSDSESALSPEASAKVFEKLSKQSKKVDF